MKIALITYEFYPRSGGISHALTSMCKSFQDKEHKIYVFNPFYKAIRIFNILDKNIYKIKDILLLLQKKKFFHISLMSIWSIIKTKKISSTDKLMIILNLLLKPPLLITTLKNIISLYPYFKKFDFDIIFGGTVGERVLPFIITLSVIFNKKVVAFAHGNEFLVRTPFSLKTYYLRNLDHIILSNRRMRSLIKRIHHLKDSNMSVVNLGLNVEDYILKENREDLRREFSISRGEFILLSVGRHVSRKRFDLVIKALSLIRKFKPDLNIKYILIGDGPVTSKLKELTKALDLEKTVQFLGRTDNLIRNKYLKLSDVFVMPSVEEKESIEGFGIVFLEANYFKLPVIGSYSGGVGEAIVNEETGLLIKPNDVNDLKEKILYLYDNKDKRILMGNRGFERVVREFSTEKIYHDYINLFSNLLQNQD
ncbi:MAG: glycosyltransferase family 4 protein [Candidatus Thorarchaeota archaeon]